MAFLGTLPRDLFRRFFPKRVKVTVGGVKITFLKEDVLKALGYAEQGKAGGSAKDVDLLSLAALHLSILPSGVGKPPESLLAAVQTVKGEKCA